MTDSDFATDMRGQGFEEAIVSGLEKPLCPQCQEPMNWSGSSTALAKCVHCRTEYKVRKNTRLFVQEVDKK